MSSTVTHVDVCFWHLADIAEHSMSAFGGKAAFDPKRTWAAQDCCRANRPQNPGRRRLHPAQKHIRAVGFLVALDGDLARVRGTATVWRLLMDETT
jgi:hypothetical protein